MPPANDKHHYEKAILTFPQQLTEGMALAKDIKVAGDFTGAAICGMGASSVAAELISSVAENHKPIWAIRGYDLSREVTDHTLIIASSFSGNTEETLSCYDAAKKHGLKIIGLSKNGDLENRCRTDQAPLVKFPPMWDGFQPRWGFGYSFAAIITILENCGIVSGLIGVLEQATSALEPEKFRALGQQTARQLYQKEPAIYGPPRLAYLARLWQMNMNEDAKTPASWNFFPEANHYETTGYTQGSGNRTAVMLRDPQDPPRIAERMKLTAALLKEKGVDSVFVDLPAGNVLYRLLGGILISMWTAYHLAALYKIDPAPTEMVEKLKKMLK